MNTGEKFNRLANTLKENTSYRLNGKGEDAIRQYHGLIRELENNFKRVIKDIVKDPDRIAKQTAIQVVSTINSTHEGTEYFDIMTRLDTLTNGGKTPIQGNTITFNSEDKILNYLEKA
jgi:hypothetical protein